MLAGVWWKSVLGGGSEFLMREKSKGKREKRSHSS